MKRAKVAQRMNTHGIGYKRYSRTSGRWGKSIAKFRKTGKFHHVQQGEGHRAGYAWGEQKGIDPESRQRKYSKNSPSFDEGVYLSKQARRKSKKLNEQILKTALKMYGE